MNDKDIGAIQMLTLKGSSIDGIMRFDGIDVDKAFNEFTEYLDGYKQFMTEEVDPSITREKISESLDRFIEKTLDQPTRVRYSDLVSFVESYPKRSEELREKVDSIKNEMIVEGVSPEFVGDAETYAEKFLSRLGQKHEAIIESVMCDNGFRNMAIPMKPKEEPKEEVPEVKFL